MSISVYIHPKSFGGQGGPSGTTWLNVETDGGGVAVIHVNTVEHADELIAAAVELKRLILGPAPHQFTRPGQVAPDRPARDACMVCGAPEAAHQAAGEGEGK